MIVVMVIGLFLSVAVWWMLGGYLVDAWRMFGGGRVVDVWWMFSGCFMESVFDDYPSLASTFDGFRVSIRIRF